MGMIYVTLLAQDQIWKMAPKNRGFLGF